MGERWRQSERESIEVGVKVMQNKMRIKIGT